MSYINILAQAAPAAPAAPAVNAAPAAPAVNAAPAAPAAPAAGTTQQPAKAPAQPADQQGGGWFSFLPIILIIVIFYFLLIRPQQRQQKEAKKREASLTPGQKVVTIGGIHGIVREVLANDVRVELAPNVVVKFAKAAIGQILTKNEEGDKESK